MLFAYFTWSFCSVALLRISVVLSYHACYSSSGYVLEDEEVDNEDLEKCKETIIIILHCIIEHGLHVI